MPCRLLHHAEQSALDIFRDTIGVVFFQDPDADIASEIDVRPRAAAAT